MSLRYIGSKTRLVEAIVPVLGKPRRRRGAFVDAFCGTGAVAEAAARLGWPIRLNDHLACAIALAHARLISPASAHFEGLGGYAKAVELLNRVKPQEGFIWREYSPASRRYAGVSRMYFTEQNAARIDGIRQSIAQWRSDSLLSEAEERLLLADLLLATNRVANIAGTYGCFLSRWSPQSQGQVTLRARSLFPKRIDARQFVEIRSRMFVLRLAPGPDFFAGAFLEPAVVIGNRRAVIGVLHRQLARRFYWR